METKHFEFFIDLPPEFQSSSFTSFQYLLGAIKHGVEIVPFIGAGVSAPFKAPLWSKFIEIVLDEYKISGAKKTVNTIKQLLRESKYEEAADLLYFEDADLFEQHIQSSFNLGDKAKDLITDSIVPSIAELCNGTIITTNFDSILEDIIPEWLNIQFEKIIPLGDFYDSACDKLRKKKHVILKIHGDWSERKSRVLTKEQYDDFYSKPLESGKINFNNQLPKLIRLISASKILLFIGCSLNTDRTLNTLKELHESQDFPHFALMSFPDDINSAVKVKERLGKAGINIIWFKKKQNTDIPYNNLNGIVSAFANVSKRLKLIENGKILTGPIAFHNTHIYNSLKKSNTIVRHSCNREQYVYFATRMLISSGALEKIIWTMNQSPLEVDSSLLDEKLLSEADRVFKKVPAVEKIRIIIFADTDELNDYIHHLSNFDDSIFKCKRIKSFENSINDVGTLMYATIDSLKNVSLKHLDIGYVLSKISREEIFFCSDIDAKKMEENSEIETIVFSEDTITQIDNPYKDLNLGDIKKTIDSINMGMQDDTSGGVYSDINNLKKWQLKHGKKN